MFARRKRNRGWEERRSDPGRLAGYYCRNGKGQQDCQCFAPDSKAGKKKVRRTHCCWSSAKVCNPASSYNLLGFLALHHSSLSHLIRFPLSSFPPDVFGQIVQYLSTEEILDMARTAHTYRHHILSSPALWSNLFGDILRDTRHRINDNVIRTLVGDGGILSKSAKAGIRNVSLAFTAISYDGLKTVLKNCPGLGNIVVGGFGRPWDGREVLRSLNEDIQSGGKILH